MSAKWRKEEDGESQLRMETIVHQRQNDERESVSSSVVGHQPTMALERATEVQLMHLSVLAPTSPLPGQGGEFSLFGMADLPQGSGY